MPESSDSRLLMGEKAMDTKVTRQLLALVRAALWNSPADSRDFIGNVDWDAVNEMALRHTVGTLVATGAFSLPEELRPPKKLIQESYAYMVRNRRTHSLVNSCLVEAVAQLRKAGIEPVLLKGQAYARYYSDPTLRQCGDIDLYIGKENYALACNASRQQGWEERQNENIDPHAKHFGCYLHGVRLELHRVAAQFPSSSEGRRFSVWSRYQLSSVTRTMRVADEVVTVPSPMFDTVFVFLHLYTHFIEGGGGLRQLCDWVMLLHAHAHAIDRDELKACLKDFGLLHAWRMFATIAVEHLGLPEQEFPFYTTRYRAKSEKLLNLVMRDGNFGHYSPGRTERPDGYWRGKLHTFIHYPRRLMTLLPLAPRRIIVAYGNFIYKGTRHVVMEKLMRKHDL